MNNVNKFCKSAKILFWLGFILVASVLIVLLILAAVTPVSMLITITWIVGILASGGALCLLLALTVQLISVLRNKNQLTRRIQTCLYSVTIMNWFALVVFSLSFSESIPPWFSWISVFLWAGQFGIFIYIIYVLVRMSEKH